MSIESAHAVDLTAIEQGRWRIDPSRSQFEFRVPNNWGLLTVKGTFERYDGTLDLRAQPAVELTIDAASVQTRNRWRDIHLRGADFFHADVHPHLRFVSDGVILDGDRLRIRGRLSAAGRSLSLDIGATVRGDGDEFEVEAAAKVDQRALGMTWSPLGVVRTPTTLIVRAHLVRDGG